MRWLKFSAAGETSWGIVEGDKVITVSGDPFGEWQRTPQTHALSDVKIELPLIPRTFYCVGLNYLKHLTEANAMTCVFGYTIGNDVSERTWQKADRGLWRSKNADTFKPMGPWIETDVDIGGMETVIRVNGKETGRFSTGDMIFGVVPFIVELTKYFTLWPGDVIWMGTDGASPDIRAGDVVEIDITGIGTLRNRFVAEKR